MLIQTCYFHVVDKYSIPGVITNAVSVASAHNTCMNARDNCVLYLAVRTDCVVHLIQATANDCHWPMQTAMVDTKSVHHANDQ